MFDDNGYEQHKEQREDEHFNRRYRQDDAPDVAHLENKIPAKMVKLSKRQIETLSQMTNGNSIRYLRNRGWHWFPVDSIGTILDATQRANEQTLKALCRKGMITYRPDDLQYLITERGVKALVQS